MQAGDLRDRVGFFERVVQSDGYGNEQGAFPADPEFEASAKIAPRLGGEGVLAGRLAGRNTVNITVRQSSATRGVTVDWKARDMRKGVDFNIRSIIDPLQGKAGQGQWLEMLCEQGVAT